MMLLRVVGIWWVCCMALGGCHAPTEKVVPLRGEYYLRYDQGTRKTKAEASFAQGGRQLVAAPGGVLLDDLPMQEISMNGATRYSLQTDGIGQRSQWAFALRSEQGQPLKTYVGLIASPGKVSFRGVASVSKGLVLQWEDKDLASTESMTLLLTDASGQSRNYTFVGPSRDRLMALQPRQLEGLQPGEGTLYLVRRKELVFEDVRYPARMVLELYTPETVFTLKP